MREDTGVVVSGHQASQGSIGSYTLGFILSILFTISAFFFVMNDTFEGWALVAALFVLALAQLLVQLIFFLHLGRESGPRWNLLVFLFMVVTVVIVVAGSVWIMYNLDYNMMPAQDVDEIMMDEAQKGF